jgi:hypothetical protein
MLLHYVLLITGNIRILIATIRNLGKCPCPHCLIPLNRVHNMGMARDMQQRETMARVDDMRRRNLIDAARRVIYEKNFRVNSTAVENMLQDTSLVPTAVCVHSENNFLNLLKFHRMHSPIGCIPLALTSSPCCFRI